MQGTSDQPKSIAAKKEHPELPGGKKNGTSGNYRNNRASPDPGVKGRRFRTSGADRDGLIRVAGPGLATTGGGDRQIGLMLPLAGPSLARPALQRDGANGRTILVADDLAPGPCVGRPDLRGTFTDAKQALTTRGQARHGSPILSA